MEHAEISKKLSKSFGKTIREYEMVSSGDKIAVGLSGGKDSLSMIHLFKRLQRIVPYEFEFIAVTVDYGDGMDLSHLSEHCATYGIAHTIYKTDIFNTADEYIRENSSFCSYFSRMRRGALYSACESLGCNKLALGHHLDDAVESFFMNMFYNGTMRTMPPKYMSKYDVEVIRPLIKCRVEQLMNFVQTNEFKAIGDEACPAMKKNVKFPHAREKVKATLSQLENEYDDLFKHMKNSFEHLHADTFF